MQTNQKLESLTFRKVGIAGCGGLGSNCAVALARVGVGCLVIADFDTVSASNLNRQYFFKDQIGMKKTDALSVNLLRINPELRIEAFDIKLNAGSVKDIFRDCDVIVEAFDLAEMKQMLLETVLETWPDRYLVTGIGLAGWGSTEILGVREYGKLIVCGDMTNEVSEECPPLAPRVGIVSNMQANMVLEVLLERL